MKLEKLETQLQTLIEEHLLKALPGGIEEIQVARQLAAAMHGSLKSEPDGEVMAANIYVLIAHPTSLAKWRGEKGLLEALLNALLAAGSEAGVHFASSPMLTTAADLSMKPGKARVLASFSGENLAETRGIPVMKSERIEAGTIPRNAFLIIQGKTIFPLRQSVVNLGRKLDNTVVIDDPRVSRNHAQLRVVRGLYMLFDLNSTGGTYVNNERITQSALNPGDVISLAGVTLIYGQDVPLRQTETNIEKEVAAPVASEISRILAPNGEDKSK
jgi:hypothetical protein